MAQVATPDQSAQPAVPAPVPDQSAQPAVPAPVAPVAPAAPIIEVPPPVWPDTTQLDQVGPLIEGNTLPLDTVESDLYDQAGKLADQAEDVVALLDVIKKSAFDDYLKMQNTVNDFVRSAEIDVGDIKESLLDQ